MLSCTSESCYLFSPSHCTNKMCWRVCPCKLWRRCTRLPCCWSLKLSAAVSPHLRRPVRPFVCSNWYSVRDITDYQQGDSPSHTACLPASSSSLWSLLFDALLLLLVERRAGIAQSPQWLHHGLDNRFSIPGRDFSPSIPPLPPIRWIPGPLSA